MPGVVAVMVFCCGLVLVVQALERHELRTGRPHRILRQPALGLPAGAPAVVAALPALAAFGLTELSTSAGIVLACAVAAATGWASLADRR